ncbi:hypothetical protein HWV62_17756 [Athelia sp. TMB]|nr:hypothetical protein HWV62_17756 [Athelia sp. TMB]
MSSHISNYTDAEQTRLAALAQQLRECELAKQDLMSRLAELELHTKTIQLEHDSLHNARARVSCIPDDILPLIFKTAAEICPPRVHFELVLSHTTRRWRNVALSTPVLWRNIRIVRWTQTELDRVSAYLARSGTMAIALFMDDKRLGSSKFQHRITADELQPVMNPHFQRCSQLVIYYRKNATLARKLRFFVDADLPQLRLMRIHNCEQFDSVTYSDSFESIRALTATPALQTLWLSGITPMPRNTSSLTTLFLHCEAMELSGLQRLPDRLSSLTSLAYLELVIGSAYEWSDDIQTIEMPGLTVLSVYMTGCVETRVWDFLAAIESPLLHTLALTSSFGPELSPAPNLTLFPSLRRLRLLADNPSITTTMLPLIASTIPHITELICESEERTEWFLAHLLGLFCAGQSPIWPHLAHLALPEARVSSSWILDLLNNREHSGRQLKKILISKASLQAFTAHEKNDIRSLTQIDGYVDDWPEYFLPLEQMKSSAKIDSILEIIAEPLIASINSNTSAKGNFVKIPCGHIDLGVLTIAVAHLAGEGVAEEDEEPEVVDGVNEGEEEEAQQGYRGRGRGGAGSPAHINSGATTPRRARGGMSDHSPRGARGRGDGFDYNSSRSGRGRGAAKLPLNTPLSKLLYQERPYLKPIIFLPSVFTRKLFEEEEDLVKPQVIDPEDTEASHVPTADRVARIFSGESVSRQEDSSSEDDAEEVADMLEEIDFSDMARIREEVDATVTLQAVDKKSTTIINTVDDSMTVEEAFTGVVVDNRSLPAPPMEDISSADLANQDSSSAPSPAYYIDTQPTTAHGGIHHIAASLGDPELASFYIDTTPSIPQKGSAVAQHVSGSILGGLDEEDDEVIVYVAPHPRTRDIAKAALDSDATPILELRNTSVLTGTTSTFSANISTAVDLAGVDVDGLLPHGTPAITAIPPAPAFSSISKFTFNSPAKKQPRIRPAFTPRERAKAQTKARKQEARAARCKLERSAMFGSFGAIMSEAQLRDERDPRWEERRRDDSDVDWGDTDEDVQIRDGGAEIDEISNGMGGMELDGDFDIDAMKAFVKGMSANGGRHVTMDDIADAERMRQEDEAMPSAGAQESAGEDSGGESDEDSSEVEALFEEEQMIIGEVQKMDISDREDSDSDLDQSPNAGFQARLERMRKNARGKKVVDADRSSDKESEDDFFDGLTRGEEDEEFIAHLEAIADEKSGTLSKADRKARKRLFQAVLNGDFSDNDQYLPAKRQKDKVVPAQLQDQWEQDRAKKAEYKRVRAQARLDAAADAVSFKAGGKKGRKAMRAAAKLDPDSDVPNRITDMFTVEQQIRRFLENIGGKQNMVFPPMDKSSRKQVHELAIAFNLKSQSKGKGSGRYTTLIKTTRSGIGIDERKIRRIVGSASARGGSFMSPVFNSGGRGGGAVPRHKEGDEVGKAAPKIGQSNVGFKMLALMGWSEGDRIGTSGGLDAPLTAVIKNTKLGLGAGR